MDNLKNREGKAPCQKNVNLEENNISFTQQVHVAFVGLPFADILILS